MHLLFDIVIAVGANDANIMPDVAQKAVCDLSHGVIKLAIGVTEFFTTVDDQNVAHDESLAKMTFAPF